MGRGAKGGSGLEVPLVEPADFAPMFVKQGRAISVDHQPDNHQIAPRDRAAEIMGVIHCIFSTRGKGRASHAAGPMSLGSIFRERFGIVGNELGNLPGE